MGLSLQGLRLREECGVWPATFAIKNENGLSGGKCGTRLDNTCGLAFWCAGAEHTIEEYSG